MIARNPMQFGTVACGPTRRLTMQRTSAPPGESRARCWSSTCSSCSALMILERWLVYPIPPVERGDWHPAGSGARRRVVRIGRRHEAARLVRAASESEAGDPVLPRQRRARRRQCRPGRPACATRSKPRSSSSTTAATATARADRTKPAASPTAGPPNNGWPTRWAFGPIEVVLMGRSLGGGVAVALASEVGARALVLENAFPTMPDVAAFHYPWLPVRWVMDNRYDSRRPDPELPWPAVSKPWHRRRPRSRSRWAGSSSTPPRARKKRFVEFPGPRPQRSLAGELLRRIGRRSWIGCR